MARLPAGQRCDAPAVPYPQPRPGDSWSHGYQGRKPVLAGLFSVMHVRLAATPLFRFLGLLGRPPSPTPLLLVPARSVHTFGMRRPIDVVFLDADLRVVRVVHALRPNRLAGARRAIAALELVAGAATMRPGDRLAL